MCALWPEMDADFDAALKVCLAWSLAITLASSHFEWAVFYQQGALDAAVGMGFDAYQHKKPMPALFKGIAPLERSFNKGYEDALIESELVRQGII
jgi:hypothetical protein